MKIKETIGNIATYILALIIFLPCLAIFSEGDDIRVNIFGYAYAAALFVVYKFPIATRFIRKWCKSVRKLFPEINKI